MSVSNSVSTAKPKPRGLGRRFEPGQSGNPAGRPRGARSRLTESMLSALADDFEKHGVAAIEAVREKDPGAYLRTIATLLPKQLSLEDEMQSPLQIVIRRMDDDINEIEDDR